MIVERIMWPAAYFRINNLFACLVPNLEAAVYIMPIYLIDADVTEYCETEPSGFTIA